MGRGKADKEVVETRTSSYIDSMNGRGTYVVASYIL